MEMRLMMERFLSSEITIKRVFDGMRRRILDIPDGISWNISGFSKINRAKLSQFKDVHKGERCFVIANGPSLKNMNLAPLKDEFTFGMNRIYLLFDQMNFEVSYLVSINELVLDQFSEDIRRLSMPKFVNWKCRAKFKDVPETYFLKTKLSLTDNFIDDISMPLSSGGTVTFITLQIAYYMGFNQVILVGLDHNFRDKGTPNKTEIRKSEIDRNHFHPNYFPAGVKWQLPDLVRSELAYSRAREIYEMNGREIIDATENGKCKVFKKISFGSVL
jgi:hypothetical protein